MNSTHRLFKIGKLVIGGNIASPHHPPTGTEDLTCFFFACIIAVCSICAATAHLLCAVYFRTKVILQPAKSHADGTGLASILMSVRGADPSLRDSLSQLLNQDYDDYEIHLVVDHRRDAAWDLVHEIKEELDHDCRLTIHEMKKPLKTCGLKCSALLEGLEEIHPNTKYMVLIDADVVPHESWLSQLIAPLSDQSIGVVTGNQWFEPDGTEVGSLLRSLWNAGALVPTAIYCNPWAGTFAMRMQDVHKARLPKIWRKSIVDDGPIRKALQPLGLQIYFNPSLIMVNREKCDLRYVQRYVSRMLTWSRMYEPTFLNTLLHCLFTMAVLAATAILTAAAIFFGNFAALYMVLAGIAVTSLLNTVSYVVVRNGVSASANQGLQPLPDMNLGRFTKLTLLTAVACLIYGFSCLQAAYRQKIQWRQITYELKGKSKVKMTRYRPWVGEKSPDENAPSEISI